MITHLSDAWLSTVNLLVMLTDVDSTRALTPATIVGRRASRKRALLSPWACVRVIERTTPTTATISWSDPTLGCYGNQAWRTAIAPHSGICAISRRPIRRGDEVFKPFCRPLPANAKAMVLAAVVNEIRIG